MDTGSSKKHKALIAAVFANSDAQAEIELILSTYGIPDDQILFKQLYYHDDT